MRIGLILVVIFISVGKKMKDRTGKWVELGSPSLGPLVLGGMFLAFAFFTTSRGTIVNNLWWVLVVTLVLNEPRTGSCCAGRRCQVRKGR